MNRHVLEISTHAFRLLRRRELLCISCSDEKDGPTQRIVVDDDVYTEIIDRAISKRKTIDETLLEFLPPKSAAKQSVAIPPIRLTLQWRVEGKLKLRR